MRLTRTAIFRLALFFTPLSITVPLFAQQITRFAVVDYNRVLQTLGVRNNAYAEFEKKTETVKLEIDKRQQEIKETQARIEELQQTLAALSAESEAPGGDTGAGGGAETAYPGVSRAQGRTAQGRTSSQQKTYEAELLRLRSDIIKKTDSLKDYYQKKTAELEADRARITANTVNSETVTQISTQIALIAEGEGYTMVLDKNTKGILWYSRSVDITDRVIAALTARRR